MKIYEIKYFSVGQFLGVDFVIAESVNDAENYAQFDKHYKFWSEIKEIELLNAYPGILGKKCSLKG
ncbi:MAG: hypothetical protein AABY22_32510 [Nanoarchaeota archaeon]|jgi:hypothetical protein